MTCRSCAERRRKIAAVARRIVQVVRRPPAPRKTAADAKLAQTGFRPIEVKPGDLEFVKSRQYATDEVANVFGLMPPPRE